MARQVHKKIESHREYLTIPEGAYRLGVSQRKFHELLKDPSDPIPHFRIGTKIVRVRITDLDTWMEKHRQNQSEVDRIVNEVLG